MSPTGKRRVGAARLTTCLSLLLCAALAVCLPGCGGIPDATRSQLGAGDSIAMEVVPRAEVLLGEVERLFTDYAAGFNTEPYGVWLRIDEYGRRASELAARAREAGVAYDRVRGMRGAGACSEYLRQRLDAMEQVEKIPGLVEEGSSIVKAAGYAGARPDENRLYETTRSLIQVSMETRYATGYADSLRSKLFPP